MPQDSPVVTGYYRYTDIWFEWRVAISSVPLLPFDQFPFRHQALPDLEVRAPVKAILGKLNQPSFYLLLTPMIKST